MKIVLRWYFIFFFVFVFDLKALLLVFKRFHFIIYSYICYYTVYYGGNGLVNENINYCIHGVSQTLYTKTRFLYALAYM